MLGSLPPWSAVLLVGALFLGAFTGLYALRRQPLPLRFLLEGGILTAAAAALCLFGPAVHPILFLVIIYVVTMRVRILVDLGNLLASRKHFRAALAAVAFALRLGPDPAGRQLALINRGVTQLRMGEPQSAYSTLTDVLRGDRVKLSPHDRAAGLYNLGVACERGGRLAEAERSFRMAIETMPGSIYALGADKALKRAASRRNGGAPASEGAAPPPV